MKTWFDFTTQVYEEAVDWLTNTRAEDYIDEKIEEEAEDMFDEIKVSLDDKINDGVLASNDEVEAYLESLIDEVSEGVEFHMYAWIGLEDCPVYEDDFKNEFTGNYDGSRTYNAEESKKNISELIFDEETSRTFKYAGYDSLPLDKGPEAFEVIAYWIALEEVQDEVAEEWLILYQKKFEEVVVDHNKKLIEKYQKHPHFNE